MKRCLAIIFLITVGAVLFAEVNELTYKALLTRHVIVVKMDGSEVIGELAVEESTSIGVIKESGEVVIVAKSEIREIREVSAERQGDDRIAGTLNPGWSKQASTMGYISAGSVLVLGVLATINYYNFPENLLLGATGTLATIVMVPVISVGGLSSRTEVSMGSMGLRTVSWIAYGLSTLNAVGLIGAYLAGYSAPVVLMVVDTALASFSLLAMALDAHITNAQVNQATMISSSFSVLPVFTLARVEDSRPSLRVGFQISTSL